MPNRILRDYTDSLKIDSLDMLSELFFVRLIMKVDDFGRFHANPKLVKSALFPYRIDSIKDAQIASCINNCAKAGLIQCYHVNGMDYLQIENFNQRLRLKTSKFPAPPSNDGQMTVKCQSNDGLKRSRNEVEVETNIVKAFRPPTQDQVMAYFSEIGINGTEYERFHDHYSGNGWKVGRNAMKDWKAACRNWKRNLPKFTAPKNTTNEPKSYNDRTKEWVERQLRSNDQ